MELSTQIKDARAKLGLSQAHAAKAWGIPLNTLKAYEKKKRVPRGLAMTKLLEILASVEAKPASASSASSGTIEPDSLTPAEPALAKRPRKKSPKSKRRRVSSRRPRA